MNGHPHYGMVVVGSGGELVLSSSPPPPPPPPPPPDGMDAFGFPDGNGAQGRWPRQETLTLLEIRTRLDSRFRVASQKAPLWDEVSRIMGEEHRYQRSGKKCREKLENLYKYYKKTKERKSGRYDGKHYRFFRQLEALYGENNKTPTASKPCFHIASTSTAQEPQETLQSHRLHERLSLSSSTGSDSSSTEEDDGDDADEDLSRENKEEGSHKRGRKGWRLKIRELVEMEMRRFMETQEAWLDKMLRVVENMEQERIYREEAWRREEAARWDREHRFWAGERAWIKARDAALIESLGGISARKLNPLSPDDFTSIDMGEDDDRDGNGIEIATLDGNLRDRGWPEPELTGPIRFGDGGEEENSGSSPDYDHLGCLFIQPRMWTT